MRLLHTMLRVKDLQKSIGFYCDLLGMEVLRQNEYLEGRFTLAFLGYGPEAEHSVIELTHNWDQTEAYELGTGYGHIAIEVDDIYAACERIRAQGGVVSREPGPMKHGTTELAFVKDPDGYAIELLNAK